MSETNQYNLEKAAAAVAAYLSQGPPLYELPLADVRKAVDGAQAGVPMPDVDEAWVTVPSEVGDVRVLIIKPRDAEAQLPVVLYMHGGGWILGSAGSHSRLAGELAVLAGAAVGFIDYALAPEAKYPVQIEQCYAVARWVTEQGESHGLDPSRIAVAGDSAGGNMATVLCIMAKQRGDVNFVQQSMYYPMTDALTNEDSESYRLFKDGPYGTAETMEWFLEHIPSGPRPPCREHRLPAAGKARRAQRPAARSGHRRRERHSPRPRRGVRVQAPRRRRANGVRPFRRHDARLHDAGRITGHRNDARGHRPGRLDVPPRVRHGWAPNSRGGRQ
jgi:acetyl esterase/lipase